MTTLFINTFLKLFFLLTPFFVISVFLSMTRNYDRAGRKRLAIRTFLATTAIALIIFLMGGALLEVFGITLDSFRVGAGALLFLSALAMVRDTDFYPSESNQDISFVPLAIPITVGPGTTGFLIVMGAELPDMPTRFVVGGAMLLAICAVGAMLYIAAIADRFLSPKVMSVLTKVTGLVVASLAAQLILTGVHHFLMP